jgi:hypothetical protein
MSSLVIFESLLRSDSESEHFDIDDHSDDDDDEDDDENDDDKKK